MNLVIPSTFTAVDKMSAPLRAMGNNAASAAAKAEAAFQRADRAVNRYTEVLNHAQKELLAGLGAAAIAYKGIEAINEGIEAAEHYEVAITKLQNNFRLSDASMAPFKKQIMDVAKESYISADKITEVFDVIGSKNRELVKQPDALAAVAKSSVILSEAWGTELTPTATNLVNIMSAFKLTDSARTIDILAGASSVGAIKGNDLAMALGSVASEAAHAHISLSQTSAILEYVDKQTNAGSDGATAFVKSLLKLESLGNSYKNAFGKFDITTAITKLQAQLRRMPSELSQNDFLGKIFGPKNIKVARSLLAPGATAELADYVAQIEKKGIAEEQAAKNTATIEKAFERVKGAFANALIESDKVGTAMNALKNILVFVYKNMDAILKVAGLLIGAFIAWKTAVLAATVVTGAYNIAIGVMGAVTGVANVAIGQSTVALTAYRVTSTITTPVITAMTTANTALGTSFTALLGPIALVAAALYGLHKLEQLGTSAVVAAGERYFKNTPPLLINTAQGVEAWDFKSKKYVAAAGASKFLKGAPTLSDAQIAQANTTGTYSAEAKPAINPELMRQNALVERSESTQKQHVKIHIQDETGRANVTTDNDMVPVTTTRTMASGFNLNNYNP
jgi:TP901 family phage tail tape measure protein